MMGQTIQYDRRAVLIGVAALPISPHSAVADDARTTARIVTTLIEAMAQNDANLIAAQFDTRASQAYGQGSQRRGNAFRAWLQSDIIDAKGRVENAELSVQGRAVVVTGRYRNDNGYSSDADFLFIVENDRIVQWTVR